jgi:hypothetical protein
MEKKLKGILLKFDFTLVIETKRKILLEIIFLTNRDDVT